MTGTRKGLARDFERAPLELLELLDALVKAIETGAARRERAPEHPVARVVIGHTPRVLPGGELMLPQRVEGSQALSESTRSLRFTGLSIALAIAIGGTDNVLRAAARVFLARALIWCVQLRSLDG
jgi:hypothetical protein